MNDYVLWFDFLRVITQSHNALNSGARKSTRRVIDHTSISMEVRAEVWNNLLMKNKNETFKG